MRCRSCFRPGSCAAYVPGRTTRRRCVPRAWARRFAKGCPRSGNGVLRALAWAISVWQIFRHASLAIVVLYAARELGFSAGRVGALWMLAGIGSLSATAAIGRLNRRLGFGPTMLAGMLGTGVGWLLLAAASGGELAASALFGLGLLV